jgi:hypothetical protein
VTQLVAALLELVQIGRDEFTAAYHRRRVERHADGVAAARERQRARVRRWTGHDSEGQ